MRIDGINLLEGSNLKNAVIAGGTTFPANPDQGELFFRTDLKLFHFYDGTAWKVITDDNTAKVNSVAGRSGDVVLSTTDVSEAGRNYYYTDARARLALSGSGTISYDNVSGAIVGAQADWDSTINPTSILNKPSIYAYNIQSISPAANTWRKFGSIAAPVGSNVDQIKLSGAMSDGTSLNNCGVEMIFSNAGDAADVTKFTKYWLIGRSSPSTRFVVFKQASGALDLWLRSVVGAVSTATFNLTSFGAGATIIPASQITTQTTTPAGTIVFDSGNQSTYPPQFYTSQTTAAAMGAVEFPTGVSTGSTGGSLTAVNLLTSGGLSTGAAAALDTLYIQNKTKVNGILNVAHSGSFSWSTSIMTPPDGAGGIIRKTGYKLVLRNIDDGLDGGVPSGWSDPLAFFQGNGDFAAAGSIASGYGLSIGPNAPVGYGDGNRSTSKIYSTAGEILQIGRSGASAPAVGVNSELSGGLWNAAASVLYVSNNQSTGRSINTGGTVNTAGTDYAEYMLKREDCGVLNPGDLVGVDSAGLLTDVFANAVKFMIKSTNPSFVGGDTWAKHLVKPLSPTRVMSVYKTVIDVPGVPAVPGEGPDDLGTPSVDEVSHRELVSAGDTDAEWVAKEAAYVAALDEFEQSMEAARLKVDRIAFCGQVPVNVPTAVAGQHVIPVDDNGKIGIQLVNDDAVTFAQYRKSVGQVIAIYPDGKAKVIVKV